MPVIDLVDPNIKKNGESKELTIQLSQDSFTYCIHSTAEKKVMALISYKFNNAILFEDMLNEAKAVVEKDSLLHLPYKKTRFLYVSRKSTLVPDEFFEPELCKRYIEFNQPLDDLDELHYNSIYRIKSKLIFAIHTYLARFITDHFKNVEFFNQSMPLIDILGGLSSRTDGNLVLINLNKDFFDMVVYNNSRLRLSNSFLYTSSNDLIYFILFASKQLNIDTAKTDFFFTGEYAEKAELIRECSSYLGKIKDPDLFVDLFSSIKLKEEHLRYFATLFKLI